MKYRLGFSFMQIYDIITDRKGVSCVQSVFSRIFCACLRGIFHSPFIDNSNISNKAGKKTKNVKSRYKPSKNFTVKRYKSSNCYYEILKNKNCRTEKVIFLLHGGSFKVKLVDMYRRLAEKYSNLLDGATVVNVDYRTFPQYEHPAQLYDARDVYLELLKSGINPENIIFIGDSAGANLTVTTTLWLRDNSYPLPSQIVCFSLWADMTSSGESRVKNAYLDPFGGIKKGKSIENYWDYLHRISAYAQNIDRESPYVSPVFADFKDFPPTTLICGGAEMDESDNDRVFEKMKKSGVNVELHKYDGMFHCFQFMSFLPESRDAYKKAFNRIRSITNEFK